MIICRLAPRHPRDAPSGELALERHTLSPEFGYHCNSSCPAVLYALPSLVDLGGWSACVWWRWRVSCVRIPGLVIGITHTGHPEVVTIACTTRWVQTRARMTPCRRSAVIAARHRVSLSRPPKVRTRAQHVSQRPQSFRASRSGKYLLRVESRQIPPNSARATVVLLLLLTLATLFSS